MAAHRLQVRGGPGGAGLGGMSRLLLALCALALLCAGAHADMSGKKLRSYLQKKMFKDGAADPVAKLSASDALDIIKVRARPSARSRPAPGWAGNPAGREDAPQFR